MQLDDQLQDGSSKVMAEAAGALLRQIVDLPPLATTMLVTFKDYPELPRTSGIARALRRLYWTCSKDPKQSACAVALLTQVCEP